MGVHLRYSPMERWTRLALCLIVTLAAPCAARGQAPPQSNLEPVRLQLKWSHQFQFAGYYAAVAQGFYAEAGFDVALVEGRSNRSPKDAVLAGEAEFGVAGSELMLGYLEGEPLVALAAIFQHSSYAILTMASSEIREPGDLAGRRVMLRDGIPSAEIFAMLRQAGVGIDRFELVTHTFRHEDLLEGKIDAMSVYLTDQPFFEGIPGAETTLLRPVAFGVDFYGDTLFTTRERLERQRDRVAAFREASLKGWRYAMENPGEIIAWIQQSYPGRRTDAQLRHEAEQMQTLILSQLVPVGQMNPARWERIAGVYREQGFTASQRDLSNFYYRELEGFDPEALHRLLWILVPLGIIVASWIAFLIHFNRRLAGAVCERTAALEEANHDLEAEARRRGAAEDAFRAGEEYYRTLLERLPVGLALSRMNGELVYVNECYATMIGRTVEQTLGLTYWELTPEDYLEQEACVLDTLIASGHAGPFEKEYLHADGHRIPVRLSAILLDRDEETFIWAFAEDITGIREAQDALARREKQYRTVFEALPLGLIISRLDGTVVDVNPAAHRMHGYTREEFLALRPEDYIAPPSIPDFGRYIREVCGGYEVRVTGRNIARNGEVLEVEVVGVPFLHQGETQSLGIIQDVTARVRAEEALHLSEEKFRSIVETTTEWIWEIDLNGKHVYCNPAIESILGYPVDSFLSMNLMDLVHPEDGARIAEALPAHIERAVGWENWVLRWRHRDGEWRHLESNAAPVFDRNGALQGFRGVDRDITDRIEAERLLQDSMESLARHQERLEVLVRERTEALEQAQADLLRKERLATLGQLIGTVSHEIRNPLGTIRGSVFSIDQMLRRKDFSRIGPVLARAERNIIRCDRIIEELLDFTRSRKLERQPTPLDAWLRDLLEDVPLENGVQCAWSLASETVVLIDRDHFRRAIVNLVNNAAQAMENGPEEDRTIRIATEPIDGAVIISIADQGAGIAPEHMEKIFEPLFSTKGFGVGLGVPIIKDIVEAHGGTLSYESTVGQGTTVYIRLPVA